MCGKALNKITKLHEKLDPIFGKVASTTIPEALGLPKTTELGDSFGGADPVDITGSTVAPSVAPTEVDGGVLAAREDERRRRAAAAGQSSTILTGGLGAAKTGQKTLLGA